MTQTRKTQIHTSDRGGVLRTVLGCMLVALGLGWCFGLLLNTVSAWLSLQLFRDTANGLGGVLCPLLPLFALWAGMLFCASARRHVSPRRWLCSFGIFLCLAGLLTLLTSVGSRENSLIDYISNNNKTILIHVINRLNSKPSHTAVWTALDVPSSSCAPMYLAITMPAPMAKP